MSDEIWREKYNKLKAENLRLGRRILDYLEEDREVRARLHLAAQELHYAKKYEEQYNKSKELRRQLKAAKEWIARDTIEMAARVQRMRRLINRLKAAVA